LGAAVRGFKKGMDEGDATESLKQIKQESADADFGDTAKTAPTTNDQKPADRNG
jgi:Sec-independent protein translocase protein TatA